MAPADRTVLARLAAEAVGTFAIVFVVVLVSAKAPGDLQAVALASGLAVAAMASATMAVSGAHLNPAVTVAMWIARRIPGPEAMAYILAQLAAGGAGALAARLVAPEAAGLPALAPEVPPLAGLVVEAVLTFLLVFVIFGTAVDARSDRRLAGVAIGFAVAMGVFAGAGLTGAAMNPARWFGPALVLRHWSDAFVWTLGPLLGAVAAAGLWRLLLLPKAGARAMEPK